MNPFSLNMINHPRLVPPAVDSNLNIFQENKHQAHYLIPQSQEQATPAQSYTELLVKTYWRSLLPRMCPQAPATLEMLPASSMNQSYNNIFSVMPGPTISSDIDFSHSLTMDRYGIPLHTYDLFHNFLTSMTPSVNRTVLGNPGHITSPHETIPIRTEFTYSQTETDPP